MHLFIWLLTAGLALGSTWSLIRFGPLVDDWVRLGLYCILLFIIFPAAAIGLIAGFIFIMERQLHY